MSIAIPCLIKQRDRQQLSGLIVGDKPNGMASLRKSEKEERRWINLNIK